MRSPRLPAPCPCPHNAFRVRAIGFAACSRTTAGHATATPPATASVGAIFSMARWQQQHRSLEEQHIQYAGPDRKPRQEHHVRRFLSAFWSRPTTSGNALVPGNRSLQKYCSECCATGFITTFPPPTEAAATAAATAVAAAAIQRACIRACAFVTVPALSCVHQVSTSTFTVYIRIRQAC